MARAEVSRWQGRLRRHLAKSGVASRSDFVLTDALEGFVHIEVVLLRPEGIYVVDSLEGEGRLMAGSRLPDWTLTGRRRFVFPNPLPGLARKLGAAGMAAGRVPLSALLVLSDGLQVPLSVLPPEVVLFHALAERLPALPPEVAVPPDYAEAWARLERAAKRSPAR